MRHRHPRAMMLPPHFQRLWIGHYFRARLHRRLFAWFGATILFTSVVVSFVIMTLHRHSSQGPWRMFIPVGVACAIVWAATGKIARRLARPLADVARVAQEIGHGNLAARAQLECRMPDEIGLLAVSINDMAMRIQRQLDDQRVLLATVSHELRTPLGHLRILLELIRSNGNDKKALDDCEREIVELDTLVGELLASSRLDFTILSTRKLDAIDVARRALERAALPNDHLELHANELEPTFVADPTLVGRALANLLDNAKKHGGGLVKLRVDIWPDRIRFEVDDAGEGLGEIDEEKLFEPFYRARGADQAPENGSLGLGLSLVKRIAEAHGGHAFASTRPEGGSRIGFEVRRETAARA